MIRRILVWLTFVVTATVVWTVETSAVQQDRATQPSVRQILETAAAWVGTSENALASIVAEERFEQRVTTVERETSSRTMRSDFLLIRVRGNDGWLPFRDVFEVDGRPVRDRTERLEKLFLESPSTALNDAARISNESSRYNLGPVLRTINVPTFGLMLLRPSYVTRFDFRNRGDDTVAGEPAWHLTFVERAKPSVVKTTRGSDVPIEGAFWIDPATGRVLKTLIKTRGTPDPGQPIPPCGNGETMMSVVVSYAPSQSLGVWVPARMDEWGRAPTCGIVTGTATYTNFRRFQVRTEVQIENEPR